ncbi:MAG: hypothetical protein O3B75_09230, partial [Planctomycetota bacterium]|nr:hypothetical protein [Planctomycetota bacterium]
PRRPTRSVQSTLESKCRRPPAELARENFPTAGHASESATESAADLATDIQRLSTHTDARRIGNTVEREFDLPTLAAE